jgi:facilitated trehalose transporter
MPPLCALVGALLVSGPLQYFGRKKTLIGVSVPFFLGFMIMGFTYFGRHKAMLYLGRLFSGLMCGATVPSSQIYVRLLFF